MNKNFVVTSLNNKRSVKVTGTVVPIYGINEFELIFGLYNLTKKEQRRAVAIITESVFMLTNNSQKPKNNIWFGKTKKKTVLYTDKNLSVISAGIKYLSSFEACETLHTAGV